MLYSYIVFSAPPPHFRRGKASLITPTSCFVHPPPPFPVINDQSLIWLPAPVPWNVRALSRRRARREDWKVVLTFETYSWRSNFRVDQSGKGVSQRLSRLHLRRPVVLRHPGLGAAGGATDPAGGGVRAGPGEAAPRRPPPPAAHHHGLPGPAAGGGLLPVPGPGGRGAGLDVAGADHGGGDGQAAEGRGGGH